MELKNPEEFRMYNVVEYVTRDEDRRIRNLAYFVRFDLSKEHPEVVLAIPPLEKGIYIETRKDLVSLRLDELVSLEKVNP